MNPIILAVAVLAVLGLVGSIVLVLALPGRLFEHSRRVPGRKKGER